jgi:dihydroorotase
MCATAHATTYSAAGITDFAKIRRVLARMEKIGMRLLIHGEEADPEIDVFDREWVFIDCRLTPWLKDFPGLKMVLEHISTERAVEFVRANAPQRRRHHALSPEADAHHDRMKMPARVFPLHPQRAESALGGIAPCFRGSEAIS